jgi:hypothetical protein
MLARSPARIPLAASRGQERSKLAHESDTNLECGFRAHPRSGITSLAGIAEVGAGRATRREPLWGAALAAVAVSAFVPGCACAPSEGGGGPAPVQCLTHGFEIMPLCGPARGVSCRVAASNTGAIPAGRASGFVRLCRTSKLAVKRSIKGGEGGCRRKLEDQPPAPASRP